ncbi:hypothetical protein L9F63_023880, partial [Diploptera punctata]
FANNDQNEFSIMTLPKCWMNLRAVLIPLISKCVLSLTVIRICLIILLWNESCFRLLSSRYKQMNASLFNSIGLFPLTPLSTYLMLRWPCKVIGLLFNQCSHWFDARWNPFWKSVLVRWYMSWELVDFETLSTLRSSSSTFRMSNVAFVAALHLSWMCLLGISILELVIPVYFVSIATWLSLVSSSAFFTVENNFLHPLLKPLRFPLVWVIRQKNESSLERIFLPSPTRHSAGFTLILLRRRFASSIMVRSSRKST